MFLCSRVAVPLTCLFSKVIIQWMSIGITVQTIILSATVVYCYLTAFTIYALQSKHIQTRPPHHTHHQTHAHVAGIVTSLIKIYRASFVFLIE